jgi:hypothetical protein
MGHTYIQTHTGVGAAVEDVLVLAARAPGVVGAVVGCYVVLWMYKYMWCGWCLNSGVRDSPVGGVRHVAVWGFMDGVA